MSHADFCYLIRRAAAAVLIALAALLPSRRPRSPQRRTRPGGRRRRPGQAQGQEGHHEADPEGARHQGRRRHGPEDPPRGQRFQRRTASRPTASPARPRSRRSACATARRSLNSASRATPTRRPCWPRSRSASRAATRPPSPPSGQYRGKYQFSQATWDALGGTGDPAEAEESVQDAIAAKLTTSAARRPGRPARAARASAVRSRIGPRACSVSTTSPVWVTSISPRMAVARHAAHGVHQRPPVLGERTRGVRRTDRLPGSRSPSSARIFRSIPASLTATAASPASRACAARAPGSRRRRRWPARPW